MNINTGTIIKFRSVIGSIIKATVKEVHRDLLIVETAGRGWIVINRDQIIKTVNA